MNSIKKFLVCALLTCSLPSFITADRGDSAEYIIEDIQKAISKAEASLKKAQEIVTLFPGMQTAQSLVRKIAQLNKDIATLRDKAMSTVLSIKELQSLKYQAYALAQQSEDIVNKYLLTLVGTRAVR